MYFCGSIKCELMSVVIKVVSSKKELREFIKFGLDLYKGNAYHVPNLIDEEMVTLDKAKNPAFEFCESEYFLALRNDKIVGTIAVIINHRANETWNQTNARFGFIEFIDDNEVVDVLFNAAETWVKDKGMTSLHGPMGFTDLDNQGMLIEGFDQLGTMATLYNYEYYPKQLERVGYQKDQDWHEFKVMIPKEIPEKHKRISEIVMKKHGLRIQKFSKRKEILPYATKIFETLNTAYAPLYGYTQLTKRQIDYYVKMYITMLRLDLVTLIVREEDEAVVGFGITLPSLSRAMQKANGNMFPFGFIHLLKALYSKPKVVDLYLIGVLPEYQNKGVNALMFYDLIPIYNKLGVVYAESNPELETNAAVQAQWNYFERVNHKKRRAYIKELN